MERPTRQQLDAMTPEQIRQTTHDWFAAQPDADMNNFDGDGTPFNACFEGWVGYMTPASVEQVESVEMAGRIKRAHVEAALTMISFVADAS